MVPLTIPSFLGAVAMLRGAPAVAAMDSAQESAAPGSPPVSRDCHSIVYGVVTVIMRSPVCTRGSGF